MFASCGGSAPTRSPRSSPTRAASPPCTRPAPGSPTSSPSPSSYAGRRRGGGRHAPPRHQRPRRPPDRRHRLGKLTIEHSRGTTVAAEAVFCAGLWSDRLAVACGAPADPRIVPFRGGLPEAGTGRRRADPRQRLPGARPRPPVPRRPPHPQLRRRRADRSERADGARPRRLRPHHVSRRDLGETLRWPGTWKMMASHWRAGPDRDAERRQPRLLRRRGGPDGPRPGRAPRRPRAPPGSAPRPSAATASWSTTSSSTAPSTPSTSATPPPPPLLRRWRSRG